MGELAAAIQQRPDLRGSTIMMLSSVGQRGDAARCKALGVAAYMTKPVRQSVLLDAIHATLSGTPGNPTHERPLVTQHSLREEKHRSLRVLLAEDNPVNRALIIQLLKKRGHQVTVAENGREAVQCHASDPLDVILMDVQMPEMDGFEATAAIREKEATSGRHIPIIALTAHAMTGDRERCLAAGMDYYLTKPVRPAELYETLEVAVAQVHGGAEGKHETGQAPAKTKAESSSDATDMEFDPTEALATVADDKELLAQMVQLFCTESPRMMAAIRSSVEASDAPALMRSAHALKGSAGNFGSSPTYESARMLEQMGRDGILTGARQQLTALETQVSRLERDLSAFVRKVA